MPIMVIWDASWWQKLTFVGGFMETLFRKIILRWFLEISWKENFIILCAGNRGSKSLQINSTIVIVSTNLTVIQFKQNLTSDSNKAITIKLYAGKI